MSKAEVIRFLEAEVSNYPGGIPLRPVSPKVGGVFSPMKRVVFVLDVTNTLDQEFWQSVIGEGVRRIVVGGLGLSMEEVDFKTAELMGGGIDLTGVELVVKFGNGDVSGFQGKLIVAPGLLDVLSSVDSKRRLWNEIKRVWR